MQSSLADAERRFGALDLSPDVFAREAAARLAPGRNQAALPERVMATAIAEAQGADLALALACECQLPRAWEVLVQHYQPRLFAVLRSRRVPAAEAEDLVADLWGELALPPSDGGTRTRIGTYRGVSSLFGWLCVILIRRGIDRHRARRLQEACEDGAAAVAGAMPTVARGE
ncbi:MAG TPA: hypothetical protein VK348_03565, partial [Planctomycetota bacterium]|nr:hypothetical protein [Planctomycetota bacterium]